MSPWCQHSPPVAPLSGSRLRFYGGEGHGLQEQPWRHREGFERRVEEGSTGLGTRNKEEELQAIFWSGAWVIGRTMEGEKQEE